MATHRCWRNLAFVDTYFSTRLDPHCTELIEMKEDLHCMIRPLHRKENLPSRSMNYLESIQFPASIKFRESINTTTYIPSFVADEKAVARLCSERGECTIIGWDTNMPEGSRRKYDTVKTSLISLEKSKQNPRGPGNHTECGNQCWRKHDGRVRWKFWPLIRRGRDGWPQMIREILSTLDIAVPYNDVKVSLLVSRVNIVIHWG